MNAGVAQWLPPLLVVLVLALGAHAVFHYRQLHQLREWLEDPEHNAIPEGRGAWSDIFARLRRLRKDERKERRTLGLALERFRQAVQSLPDGVILLDGDGYIEWLNAAAHEHFNLDPERDVGTLIEQLVRHESFYLYLQDFRDGKNGEPLILTVGNEQGKCVLSLLLLRFAYTGTLLLSRDITEIARTETIRRDFIANVSHELRTPLTVISGFLEELTAPGAPTGEAAHGFLTLMAEQALRMNRLVADLLTLSRLENTTEPPRNEVVDVPALTASLLAEGQALSGGRHAVELGEVTGMKVRGSTDELRSAFGNLVSNAVRYTPLGGRITLSWQLENGMPTFSVSDTGIGIPAEHIPRLTERFYRVDKGRSTASGGTGLGLAIVKHVLARHHGLLAIRSQVGEGSTFSALLPAERIVAETP
ncbi:MAG: two-component system, OmpR family, phosphate regulon sensor histidine kinase PhoR [Pseudomonadota bacterium]|nr:two-component system, OmpR family, phosphate regulon sensor histidine kinase PhoR [Pseudomonadota bacterium]